MKKAKKIILVIIVVILVIISAAEKISRNKVSIGLITTMSGEYSNLGTSLLNGALMAAEEINKNKKFYERKIDLIIRDDRQDVAEVQRLTSELIDDGVAAIIGLSTSKMAVAASEVGNKRKKLIISAIASTSKLSGKDDYFIRLTSTADKHAIALSEISKEKLKIKNVLLIYDDNNIAYAGSFKDAYINEFTENNINKVQVKTVRNCNSLDSYFDPSREIEGVVIIAKPIDTARIVQQVKKTYKEIPILSSGWAYNQNFITYGGKYAEGVYTTDNYNYDYPSKEFIKFKENYMKKFGIEPGLSSLSAYEGFNILVNAIEKTKSLDSEELKRKILSSESDPFFIQPGSFDKFGDCEREIIIFQVKDGKFERVEI